MYRGGVPTNRARLSAPSSTFVCMLKPPSESSAPAPALNYWLGLDSRNARLIVGMEEERRPEGILHPGEFVLISAKPQIPWRGERLCVWSRCAASFFIHDVKVGNRSSFACASLIPADAFATRLDQLAVIDEAFKRDGAVVIEVTKGAVDVLGMPFVLPVVQPGMEIAIYVEHIGTEPMRFVAGFLGKEVKSDLPGDDVLMSGLREFLEGQA